MIIKHLELHNYGKFSEVKVDFNENVTYLIGPNGSSKSTLGLYGIWFTLQGISEKSSSKASPIIGERFRFIKPGFSQAKGILVLEDKVLDDTITITRIVGPDQNRVKIESSKGRVLDQNWLNELFNVFLLAPKRFYSLKPEEQTKALGIDVSPHNAKLKQLKAEYTEINAVIRNSAHIQVESEKDLRIIGTKIDVSSINTRLANIGQTNNEILIKNQNIDKIDDDIYELEKVIEKEEAKLKEIQELIARTKTQLQQLQAAKESPDNTKEELQSTEVLLKELQDANEFNKSVDADIDFNEKAKAKLTKMAELQLNKSKQDEAEMEKNAYLLNCNLGVKDLKIDVDGCLTYKDRFISEPYFSTGELIMICIALISRSQVNKHDGNALQYVFIQDWELLDEDNQKKIMNLLQKNNFQIVIEHVGTNKIDGEGILLSDITNPSPDNG